MQIQGINPDQVFLIIGNYIDKGWHQVALGADSRYMNDIMELVNNSGVFQQILQSNQVGINAMHLSDADEFVITLVFNPSSEKAIDLMKSFLKELKTNKHLYGKKLLSKHVGKKILIDSDLEKLIDSFWQKQSFAKHIKKVCLLIVIIIVLTFGTYKLILNTPGLAGLFSNQTFLELIYNRSKKDDVKIKAVQKITDEQFLSRVALQTSSSKIQLEAVNRIADRDLLMNVLTNINYCEQTLKSITNRIDDETFFITAAEKATNQMVQRFFLSEISNQEVLIKFTEEQYPKMVRERAVELLTDEKFLSNIVKYNNDRDIREAAARKIKNNETLIYLYENYKDDKNVRLALIKNITDQDFLFKVAKGEPGKFNFYSFSYGAAKKITDEKKLIDLARNAIGYDVRELATKAISDEQTLIEIAKTDSKRKVVTAAIEKIDDEKALTDIAIIQNEGLAVSKVNSEELLLKIAFNATSRHTIRTAINKINSPELLRKIINESSYNYGREIAEKRLNKLMQEK